MAYNHLEPLKMKVVGSHGNQDSMTKSQGLCVGSLGASALAAAFLNPN